MTERTIYPRSSCVMPGCRRWSTRFKGEWICGEHWRLVPRELKLLRARMRKRWTPRFEKAQAVHDAAFDAMTEAKTDRVNMHSASWWERIEGGWAPGGLVMAHAKSRMSWMAASRAWIRGEDALWRRMKRAAIERAAGI